MFDAAGGVIQSWQWQTQGNLQQQTDWQTTKTTPPGNYTVSADEWWSNQLPEIMDSKTITISARVPDSIIASQWMLYAAIVAAIVALVLIGLMRLHYKQHIPLSPSSFIDRD